MQHATRHVKIATHNIQRATRDDEGQQRATTASAARLDDAYERARVDFAAEADAVGKRRGDARAKENHL